MNGSQRVVVCLGINFSPSFNFAIAVAVAKHS